MSCELCNKGRTERDHNCLRHSICAPNEFQLWNPGLCEDCKTLFEKADGGCKSSINNIKFIFNKAKQKILKEKKDFNGSILDSNCKKYDRKWLPKIHANRDKSKTSGDKELESEGDPKRDNSNTLNTVMSYPESLNNTNVLETSHEVESLDELNTNVFDLHNEDLNPMEFVFDPSNYVGVQTEVIIPTTVESITENEPIRTRTEENLDIKRMMKLMESVCEKVTNQQKLFEHQQEQIDQLKTKNGHLKQKINPNSNKENLNVKELRNVKDINSDNGKNVKRRTLVDLNPQSTKKRRNVIHDVLKPRKVIYHGKNLEQENNCSEPTGKTRKIPSFFKEMSKLVSYVLNLKSI